MVAYNSKYIYPFGGSAEVPEEDPDKQIGEYMFNINVYMYPIQNNPITHDILLHSPLHLHISSWWQRTWAAGHV